ncbi:MAG: peptidoglycan DD-metalloendopeptidase family protein [Nitrospirota bacterium]
MLKKILLLIAGLLILAFLMMHRAVVSDSVTAFSGAGTGTEEQPETREIRGTIAKGETFFDIFRRNSLAVKQLFELKEASAGVHRLRDLRPGQSYKIVLDDTDSIDSLSYWIDEDSVLDIIRGDAGFYAEKNVIQYEKRTMHIGGAIKNNLFSSIGGSGMKRMLALELSDIFAWDIDFNTDVRNGDEFRIVVEGNFLDDRFRKFGDVLSAEFVCGGEKYKAYRYEYDGTAGYYDEKGRSLRKAFLKAPLNFRRISSGFSRSRLHPILKIYRPHHGIDYAAPVWTPVSAVGDGTVMFAGYKRGYGKLVEIRHPNGYRTLYGHLSKFGKGAKNRAKVKQGEIIGYVGNSGLSTGPHLHFEMKINNRPVNPLRVKMPRGKSIPDTLMADFRRLRKTMDAELAATVFPVFASGGQKIPEKTAHSRERDVSGLF